MSVLETIPARMLNEVVYCPRLYAIEHLFGEWAESPETLDGKRVHARVDRPQRSGLPAPEDLDDLPADLVQRRSVLLSNEDLGMVARLDLVDVSQDEVVPVDFKRGSSPDLPEQAWLPERVQVCAQVLLLRAHGYTVPHGVLWFAGARRRVVVDVTDELVAATLQARDTARSIALDGRLPAPLVDSPKCRGCSLAGICLPDEHATLTGARDTPVRPLMPPRDDGVPLYVTGYGVKLGQRGGELVVRSRDGERGRARYEDTSRVVLQGEVSVSTAVLRELASRDIPLTVHSRGGWFYGAFHPASGKNVQTRIAQHAAAQSRDQTLALARGFVAAKIHNQRTLLRRNARSAARPALAAMQDALADLDDTETLDQLRGLEGYAARSYFGAFAEMIRSPLQDTIRFKGRNRRPPRDPVNALLSFAYACLARELTTVCHQVGLDAWVGYLHRPRAGRPSLALDLMEEFRPIIADSAVLTAINKGEVQPDHFILHPTGVSLPKPGKKVFIRAFARRIEGLVTHPVFGSRLSYRRVLEVQVRLLGQVLRGELDTYPGFRVR